MTFATEKEKLDQLMKMDSEARLRKKHVLFNFKPFHTMKNSQALNNTRPTLVRFGESRKRANAKIRDFEQFVQVQKFNVGSVGKPSSPRPTMEFKTSSFKLKTTKKRSPTLKDITYDCKHCGKIYKHKNCLMKHEWEHCPEWQIMCSSDLTKHSQVKIMEAAHILSHFK